MTQWGYRPEPEAVEDESSMPLGTSPSPVPVSVPLAPKAPRVLVMTVVHDPDDARIRYRQLTALLAAGMQVTYAAPFEASHRRPPEGVTAVDLPRQPGGSGSPPYPRPVACCTRSAPNTIWPCCTTRNCCSPYPASTAVVPPWWSGTCTKTQRPPYG